LALEAERGDGRVMDRAAFRAWVRQNDLFHCKWHLGELPYRLAGEGGTRVFSDPKVDWFSGSRLVGLPSSLIFVEKSFLLRTRFLALAKESNSMWQPSGRKPSVASPRAFCLDSSSFGLVSSLQFR
jgi:hypothetical protein